MSTPADREQKDDDANNENQQSVSAARPALFFGLRFSRAGVFAADCLADQVDPGGQSAFVIIRPKARFDVALGNVESGHVRQRAFQAVSDLNVHLPIFDEDEEDRAVFPVFLAAAPRLRDALGVILDGGIGLHLSENSDQNLIRCFTLELGEPLIETERRLFRDNPSVVVEIAGWFRRNSLGGPQVCNGKRHQRRNQQHERFHR